MVKISLVCKEIACSMSTEKYFEAIESDGYCIIPQVLAGPEIQETLDLVKKWYESTREESEHYDIPRLKLDTEIVYNLQNKEYQFLKVLFASKDIEKILMHYLNDEWYKRIPADRPNYILGSYFARSSRAPLKLHLDSYIPFQGQHQIAMQYVVLLEDSHRSNGCTVVVPGSHKFNRYCDQSAMDRAVPIEGRAGDIIVWDSRIWHGALPNDSGRTRWALVATFVRWWVKQVYVARGCIPADILDRLTDSQKAVLGLCSMPYEHERQGIDIRGGYERLAEAAPESPGSKAYLRV